MKNEKEKTGLSAQKVIFLGVFMAILAVGGGVLGSFITSGKAAEFLNASSEKDVEEVRIMVPYEEFLVNLTPLSAGERTYLRIEFSFEVGSEENEALLKTHEAKIRDNIITVLRRNNAGTIFEEVEGDLRVKTDIKDRINQLLGGEVVKEIYVINIVMQ